MDQQDREALQYLSRELETYESRIYEHISSGFRWVMATLFAANGGALVALMSGDKVGPADPRALLWFGAGVFLSLLMGVLSTIMAFRTINPLVNARVKVNMGLSTGDRAHAETAISELEPKMKMKWWNWSPSVAGLLSGGCWLGGAWTVAVSLLG